MMTRQVSEQAPIIPVILCGGMGSRLWPVSRRKFPKQFIAFGEDKQASLLAETARRLKSDPSIGTPVVVSGDEHRFLVAEHLRRAGCDRADIILEPVMRNTAPAITAAALFLAARYKEALMLVLPSDHLIGDGAEFMNAVAVAAMAARQGNLVTFGVTPTYAETGYGYIRRGEKLCGALRDKEVYRIGSFVEKPDSDTAAEYLASGEYAWNSGMFMFPVSAYLGEVKTHRPEIHRHVEKALAAGDKGKDFIRLEASSFGACPNVSVDYAVMEHTDHGVIVPLSCGWSDAGAWDALWRIGTKDASGNVSRGRNYAVDVKDSYIHQFDGPPVAALGVDDLVVISTRDMVLVTKKDRAQEVKQLMEHIGQDNKQLVEQHQRVFRPWGYYETIELADRHQVKHIHVHPGAKLSVQMHHHRAEHWVVTGGTARVQCDGEEMILSENQYVYIPLGSVHTIENIGRIGLDFIEVQHGGYLGEDDIVRLTDIYGRAPVAA